MRGLIDAARVERFLLEVGRSATGPGSIFLVGGTTAVLMGWRESTVDVDLYLDPEPAGIFEALARIKNELEINVELAAPHDFIPRLPDWRTKSRFIVRHGKVDFFHYDLRAQALAKIERDHATDRRDVDAMFSMGLVEPEILGELYEQIASSLMRYPAIDPDAFRQKVSDAVERARETRKK